MASHRRMKRRIRRVVTHTLVAVLASVITFAFCWEGTQAPSKLDQLESLITERFIGSTNQTAMEDAAAAAMVAALGDRWSYYIPASQYNAHKEQMENAYVGVGVTISQAENEAGLEILAVDPKGGAMEAGILPGDILVEVEGQPISGKDIQAVSSLIQGEEGSEVSLSVMRDGKKITFSVVRKTIQKTVAKGELLEGNIGLVTIYNFDDRCADETIAAIDALVEKGAEALIFDVRGNPGGYKHELVKVLDYLLPEGPLFRSVYYTGHEEVDKSDARCLELPMAVLVDENSFSAAEFFAAALEEYDWAVTVGEPTVGKSYFQHTIRLSDGSAVGLSVGKYTTPKGVSLADVGGLKPQIRVDVDKDVAAKIYAGLLDAAEDPQIQAAVAAVTPKIGNDG